MGIPAGFHTVTPFLTLADPPAFIDFAVRAFGAREIVRIPWPDGRVRHAQIEIGDSRIMLGLEREGGEPMKSFLHLYVPDVDALHARALRAGAIALQEPADQPWGDRQSVVRDPFGNLWGIATHLLGSSAEESRRA